MLARIYTKKKKKLTWESRQWFWQESSTLFLKIQTDLEKKEFKMKNIVEGMKESKEWRQFSKYSTPQILNCKFGPLK